MKWIFAVIAIVVVAGLGWWYLGGNVSAPVVDMPMITETESGNAADDTAVTGDVVVDTPSVPAPVDAAQAKAFNITGKPFEFSQKEIRIKKGDTVTINFESTNGFHDWVVDEFSARTEQVRPGTKTSTTFVADKAGTFEYYCSVGNHRAEGMKGKLIVE